uniref:phosphorylase n=1 Tax=Alistipes sp. Marseille-P5061 TaxID=2048242 RepID=UPI000D0FA69F|nr:phosphorylase [Alistipes sp. Marseille-P5061]
MRRIFIFPTIEEAKAFILTGTKAPVFVAGGSAAETAACIVRAVRAKRPHHLVLAGFAQLHDGTLSPETVVEVVTARDRTGCEEHLYQTTGPDLGLPLADGVVPGPEEAATEGYGAEEAAPEAFEAEQTPPEAFEAAAAGEPNGPNKAAGTEVADEEDETDGTEEPDDTDDTDGADDADGADGTDDTEPLPKVGSREGALLFALAEAFDIEASELRVIVGERGDGTSTEQERQLAGQQLARTLQRLFGEQTPAEAPSPEA